MRRSPRRAAEHQEKDRDKDVIAALLKGGELSDTSSSSDDTNEIVYYPFGPPANKKQQEKKSEDNEKPKIQPIIVSDGSSQDVVEVTPQKNKNSSKKSTKKKDGPSLKLVDASEIPERFQFTRDPNLSPKKAAPKESILGDLKLVMEEHHIKEHQIKPTKDNVKSLTLTEQKSSSNTPHRVTNKLERPQPMEIKTYKLGSIFDIPSSESSEPFTKETQPLEFSLSDKLPMYFMNLYEEGNRLFLFGKYKADPSRYNTISILINHPIRCLQFLPIPGHEANLENYLKTFFGESLVSISRVKKGMISNSDQKEWFEVTINSSFNISEIPLTGKDYSDVFGVTASLTETFLLRKRIKGPRWIYVKCAQSHTNHTTIPLFICDNIDDIYLNDDETNKPSMNICVFSMYSHESQNNQEIFMISARIFYQWDIEKFEQYRGLAGGHNVTTFLWNGAPQKSQQKTIVYCENENQVLDLFFQRLDSYDIDILCSYDLIDNDIPLFMTRSSKVPSVMNLGRIRRTEQQKTIQGLTAGRILFDLKNFYSNVLGVSQSSFSALVRSELHVNFPILDKNNLFTALSKTSYTCNNVIGLSRKETLVLQNLLSTRGLIMLSLSIARISGCNINSIYAGDSHDIIEQQMVLLFNRTNYIVPDRKISSSVSHLEAKNFLEDACRCIDGIYGGISAMFDFQNFFCNVVREYGICMTKVDGNRKDKGVLPAVLSEYANTMNHLLQKPTKDATDSEMISNKAYIDAISALSMMFEDFFVRGSRRFDIAHIRDVIREKSLSSIDKLAKTLNLGEKPVVWCSRSRVVLQSNIQDKEEALAYFSEFAKRFNDSNKKLKIEFDTLLKKSIVVNGSLISMDHEGKFRTERGDNSLRYRTEWTTIECKLFDSLISSILTSNNDEDAAQKCIEEISHVLDILRRDAIKNVSSQDLSIAVDLNEMLDPKSPIVAFVDELRSKNRLPILDSVIRVIMCRNGASDGRSIPRLLEDVADTSFADIPYYRGRILETAATVLKPFKEIRAIVANKYIAVGDCQISIQCSFCTKRFVFTEYAANGTVVCPLCSTIQSPKWAANQLAQSIRKYLSHNLGARMSCNEYLCNCSSLQMVLQGSQTHTDACNECSVCGGHLSLGSESINSTAAFANISRLFLLTESSSELVDFMNRFIRKLAGFYNIDIDHTQRRANIVSETNAYALYSSSQSDVCSFLSQ